MLTIGKKTRRVLYNIGQHHADAFLILDGKSNHLTIKYTSVELLIMHTEKVISAIKQKIAFRSMLV